MSDGDRRVPSWGRLLISIGLLVAAALSLLHAVDTLAGPALAPLDTRAEAVAEGIAVRAGAAFAVSKTINAALSFAEEVTITGSAFVVEGSMQPAAVLRPVNNLVDQFARIMLVVAASALLIEILLHIGAGYGTWILLAIPLALFAVGILRPDAAWGQRVLRVARDAAVLAVVLRLALPVALMLTGAVSDRFLADRYDDASAGLEVLQETSDAAAGAAEEANATGWTGQVREAVTQALSLVSESFGNTFHNVVTLVTVFLMETVLLPLAIVFLLYRGLYLLFGRHSRG